MVTRDGAKASSCLVSRDNEILNLVTEGRRNMESIATHLGLNGAEVASSLQRLISTGRIFLIAVQNPWGIEYEIHRKLRRSLIANPNVGV